MTALTSCLTSSVASSCVTTLSPSLLPIRYPPLRRSNSGELDANPNMELALLTTVDTRLLAKADLLVGKFTSNLFRTAYELKAASCDCAPPFMSLDVPWCFDWAVNVGGNGTFEC